MPAVQYEREDTALLPVKEVIGAQLPSVVAASATSHSFKWLSVDALMTWLLPTHRTYDTAFEWPPMTARGAEICNAAALYQEDVSAVLMQV